MEWGVDGRLRGLDARAPGGSRVIASILSVEKEMEYDVLHDQAIFGPGMVRVE